MMQLPGAEPPWTPNPTAQPRPPQVEHRSPGDEPPQPGQQRTRPKIDTAQIKRDADQLAKLAAEVPPEVEQANQGALSKDLNDRLKRIEKLSKQLRREIFQ